jgi:signal transduction histidine kinase
VPFAHAALVLVVLAGILAVSVSTLAADPPSFFGFLASVTLPMFAGLLVGEMDQLHVVTAAVVGLFGVTLGFVYRRTHSALVEHLRTTALLAMSEEAAKQAEAAMREARDFAERTAQARTSFLANMSHEIRTPMNGILGMASLLLETSQTPEQQTYAHAIDQSARTLLALIDEILDFSKIEAGKLELSEAPFAIESCIQCAVELLAPRAHEKGLEMAWSVDPELPKLVAGDEARVRQILLKLLSNAVKFTDTGGVCVSALARPEPDLNAVRVEIAVEDTGIGLSRSDMQGLFSEFEQADAAIRRRNGGTGLGLAISMQLARAMRGEIRVLSAPGKGSTFTVDI